MMDFFEDFGLQLLALAIIAAILIGGAIGLDAGGCNASWKDSGMPLRWTVMGGCQLQVHGAWIPADNYREVPK